MSPAWSRTRRFDVNNSATPVEPHNDPPATDPSSRGCVVRRSGRVVSSAKRRRRNSSADPPNNKDAERQVAADGEPRRARVHRSDVPTSRRARRLVRSAEQRRRFETILFSRDRRRGPTKRSLGDVSHGNKQHQARRKESPSETPVVPRRVVLSLTAWDIGE